MFSLNGEIIKLLLYLMLVFNFFIVSLFLTRRRSRWQTLAAVAITLLLVWVVQPLLWRLTANVQLANFLSGFLFCLPVLYVFAERWTKKLFVFFLVFATVQYVRLFFSFAKAALLLAYSPLMPPVFSYVLVLVVELVMLLVCYYFLLRKSTDLLVVFKSGNVLLGVAPVIICFSLAVIRINGVFDWYTLFSTLGITLILAAVLHLLKLTLQMTQRKNTLESQLLLQMAHYQSLTHSIEQSRRDRHDLRHHLAGIAAFVQKRDLAAAQAYLQSLEVFYSAGQTAEFCTNKYLDAVLAHYFKIASQRGLAVKLAVQWPATTQLLPLDVCVILGNFLEQGLAALGQDVPAESVLSLEGVIEANDLVLTLRQTLVAKKLLLNRTRNTEEWLESVRLLVKKYNGELHSSQAHNIVTTVVTLPVT